MFTLLTLIIVKIEKNILLMNLNKITLITMNSLLQYIKLCFVKNLMKTEFC